jgi:subtilisin family serine protease
MLGRADGSFSIVLAVLDTGLDAGHPEFSGRAQSGWDYVNNDNDPTDDHGHGTACTGIAAAAGNNGQGVAGVAWGVRILPIKVLNGSNSGTAADLASGITFAADFGARVLSMSLGFGTSQTVQTAVNYAYGLDCLMVAATGNNNTGTISFPAAYDHVFAVGALSPCNERKSPTSCDAENGWGSNFGPELDVMAPGVRIHTTDIRGAGGFANGDYTSTFNGTSAATPFVAGIAALMRSQQPNLSNDIIATIMAESCDDLGTPGWDQQTGWAASTLTPLCVGLQVRNSSVPTRAPKSAATEIASPP